MVAVRLALEDIAEVNLGDGYRKRAKGVQYRNRGVRIGARVQNKRRSGIAGFLDPVYELALVICLAEVDRKAFGTRPVLESVLDGAKRLGAVNAGLSLAYQVKVWSIQDEDRLHFHYTVVEAEYAPYPAAPGRFTLSNVAFWNILKRKDHTQTAVASCYQFLCRSAKALGFFFVFCTIRRGAALAAILARAVHKVLQLLEVRRAGIGLVTHNKGRRSVDLELLA